MYYKCYKTENICSPSICCAISIGVLPALFFYAPLIHFSEDELPFHNHEQVLHHAVLPSPPTNKASSGTKAGRKHSMHEEILFALCHVM